MSRPPTRDGEFRPSWLCPSADDLRRLHEAFARADNARTVAALATTIGMLACAPWIGWVPFFIGVACCVQVATVGSRALRAVRPEVVHAASFAATTGVLVGGVAASGGARSPVLPLCTLPMLLLASRFRPRVAVFGLACGMLLVAAATVTVDRDGVVAAPETLVVTLLLMAASLAITMSFTRVELRLRDRTRRDPLTGLLNRLGLDILFDQTMTAARAADEPVSLIVMDLDHFKRVNDTHGHDQGDRVLAATADVLLDNLRAVDLVFRLGGEEFAVLLPGVGPAPAAMVAERLRGALEATPVDGHHVTLSAGIVTSTTHTEGWRGLYRRADAALLAAKRGGRNRCTSFGDITLPMGRHERAAA